MIGSRSPQKLGSRNGWYHHEYDTPGHAVHLLVMLNAVASSNHCQTMLGSLVFPDNSGKSINVNVTTCLNYKPQARRCWPCKEDQFFCRTVEKCAAF